MKQETQNESNIDAEKTTRNHLKSVFKRGACPTEEDFAGLIDACLNKSDDGFEKGIIHGPLKVQTDVDDQIMVFSRVHDGVGGVVEIEDEGGSKDWCLSIHENDDTGESCLSISQQDNERPILYLHDLGRVGIGTDQPKAKMHITGNAIVDRNFTIGGDLSVTGSVVIQNAAPRKNVVQNGLQALVDQSGDQNYDLCDSGGTLLSFSFPEKFHFFENDVENTTLMISGHGGRHTEQQGPINIDVCLKDEEGTLVLLGQLSAQDSGIPVVFPAFVFSLDDESMVNKTWSILLQPDENTVIEDENQFNIAVLFS